MYPRTEYEMTQQDLDTLMEAMKPVPAIMLQCGNPPSQQENANSAWQRLGEKMGFDYNTVQPIGGKGVRFFSAVPNEPEEVRAARVAKEAEEAKQKKIAALQDNIAKLSDELAQITAAEQSPAGEE